MASMLSMITIRKSSAMYRILLLSLGITIALVVVIVKAQNELEHRILRHRQLQDGNDSTQPPPELSFTIDCPNVNNNNNGDDSRRGTLTVTFNGLSTSSSDGGSSNPNNNQVSSGGLSQGIRPWIGLYNSNVLNFPPFPRLPNGGLVDWEYTCSNRDNSETTSCTDLVDYWQPTGQITFDVTLQLSRPPSNVAFVIVISTDDFTAATTTEPFTLNTDTCNDTSGSDSGNTNNSDGSSLPVDTGDNVASGDNDGNNSENDNGSDTVELPADDQQQQQQQPDSQGSSQTGSSSTTNWQPQAQRRDVCSDDNINNTGRRERRPWRMLTCDQQNEFINALQLLKDSGIYDEFVQVHIDMNNLSHIRGEFLPWHRWFLLMFETALQDVTGNCDLTVPYWDWERDSGTERSSDVFHSETFGRFECGGSHESSWAPFAGRQEDRRCLRRTYGQQQQGPMDGNFATETQLLGFIMNFERFADTTDSNNPQRMNGFHRALEGQPHSRIHWYIGGPMFDARSPMDPLFWLHHATVDRHWTTWQDYWNHDTILPNEYRSPNHYDGEDIMLDDPLPFSRNTRWDYSFLGDGSNSFPTPRQILNNLDLRVRYIDDNLAALLEATTANDGDRRYISNPNLFDARINDVVQCNRARRASLLRRSDKHRSSGKIQALASTQDGPYEGTVILDSMEKNDSVSNTPSICISTIPPFRSAADRERWVELCEEGTMQSSAEMMAILAELDCNDRVIAIRSPSGSDIENEDLLEQWISHMGLSSVGEAVLECFHRPDEV